MAFGHKKVDSILAGARKIVAQLRTCAEQERKLANEQQAIMEEAQDKARDHIAEGLRAEELATNWDKLVNGE